MMPRVYVAGPISKGDLFDNVRRAHIAAIQLARSGCAPLVPHGSCFWGNHTCPNGSFKPQALHSDLGHGDWLGICLAWLRSADAVLRLPGESAGADIEVRFAEHYRIPVFSNVQEVVAWAAARSNL